MEPEPELPANAMTQGAASPMAHRPPLDGTGAAWASYRWLQDVKCQAFKNTLLHVLVNDTASELKLQKQYVDSGCWLAEPPEYLPAFSCAAWASRAATGFLGFATGTCGSLLYRASGHRSFDLVVMHSMPVVGTDKAGASVSRCSSVSKLQEEHERLIDVDAEARTHAGVHVSWVKPHPNFGQLDTLQLETGGAQTSKWVVSDDISRATVGLKRLLSSAGRSMLVAIDNKTMLCLRLRQSKTARGIWRTHPPQEIPAATKVVFASESGVLVGTEACVSYDTDVSVGGNTSSASVSLRWNNPKAAGRALQGTANKHGVYVEVSTEFTCSPGIVCTWHGPTQSDHSDVTFTIDMQPGAQPMRYHPVHAPLKNRKADCKLKAKIPPARLVLPDRRDLDQVIVAQLEQKLSKAARSMLVVIDNRTPFTWELLDAKAEYGAWSSTRGAAAGAPPLQIDPNEEAVIGSESTVWGSQATVTYKASMSLHGDNKDSDDSTTVATATFMLRWVNPKIDSAIGKWAEIKTDFDCQPGLAVLAFGPTQDANSKVRFELQLQNGAMPMHINPDKQRTFLRGSATKAQDKKARASFAYGVHSAGITEAASRTIIWSRCRPRARMYKCQQRVNVYATPMLIAKQYQLLGTLPKNQLIRVIESCWVDASLHSDQQFSWLPRQRYLLAGSCYAVGPKQSFILHSQDGENTHSQWLVKDEVNIMFGSASSGVIIGTIKKDVLVHSETSELINEAKLAIRLSSRCWISQRDADGCKLVQLLPESLHPPIECRALCKYSFRKLHSANITVSIPLSQGRDIVHYQIFHYGNAKVKSNVKFDPPTLATSSVDFRRTTGFVNCWRIKTFQTDDNPSEVLRPGIILRSHSHWHDPEVGWKLQGSRGGGSSAIWLLQDPPDSEHCSLGLEHLPEHLGLQRNSQGKIDLAMGEYSISLRHSVVTVPSQQTQHSFTIQVSNPSEQAIMIEIAEYQQKPNTLEQSGSGSGQQIQKQFSRTTKQRACTREVPEHAYSRLISRLTDLVHRDGMDLHVILNSLPSKTLSSDGAACSQICKTDLSSMMRALEVDCSESQLETAMRLLAGAGAAGSVPEVINADTLVTAISLELRGKTQFHPQLQHEHELVSPEPEIQESPLTGSTNYEHKILDDVQEESNEVDSYDTDVFAQTTQQQCISSAPFDWLESCPLRCVPERPDKGMISASRPLGQHGNALAGGAVGAAVGSVVPGLGTVIGVAVGAIATSTLTKAVRDNLAQEFWFEVYLSAVQRSVHRQYADFQKLDLLLRRSAQSRKWAVEQPKLPPAINSLEGVCKLARELDEWITCAVQLMFESLRDSADFGVDKEPVPYLLGFLGLLFPAVDRCPPPVANCQTWSTSSSDSEEDDQEICTQKLSSRVHCDEMGGPDRLGPWRMVGGQNAYQQNDCSKQQGAFGDVNGPLFKTVVLQNYHLCRVEWRVNYSFVVSKIPGHRTGAHSILALLLENAVGGAHWLIADLLALTPQGKVRLRLLPQMRWGEWCLNRQDPGSAMLFRAAAAVTASTATRGAGVSRMRNGISTEELWEQLRTQSKIYNASTYNCHHFARQFWNWAVESEHKTEELPWANSEAVFAGIFL